MTGPARCVGVHPTARRPSVLTSSVTSQTVQTGRSPGLETAALPVWNSNLDLQQVGVGICARKSVSSSLGLVFRVNASPLGIGGGGGGGGGALLKHNC